MTATQSFITDDFLLSNDTARRLYHDHAAGQPIYDYHCHLPPQDLAANRRFNNLFEAWLEGDHYKWRAMRANGVAEEYCTGNADPYEKFLAFAKTVPSTLRNPLYHWTHLELKRYFGIDTLLNGDTAREVWDEANRQLQQMPVSTILERFNVALIGTTDDPTDTLEHHQRLHAEKPYDTAVYPAFRPDKAMAPRSTADDPTHAGLAAWNAYVDKLAAASGHDCNSLETFLQAIAERHAFFHRMGSRLSDHGLTHLPDAACSLADAHAIFNRLRSQGVAPEPHEADRFNAFLMLFFGELDANSGWVKQLHLGAMRNNNGWAMQHLGPDTGFDSIGDYPQGPGLSRYLGTLAKSEKLPKTILYNLNPADNYLFATMAGNFNLNTNGAGTPGKMQFGSGWWFLDQKEGMTAQMNALSNLGLLPRFVGMLTDSRSFLSYPRHEYFRRILCDLLGRDAESGELPNDRALLGRVVEDICFNNAKAYFGMQLSPRYA